MNDTEKIITLLINTSEITTSQFDDIVRFASTFHSRPNQIEVVFNFNKFPLIIKGENSNLSRLAKFYFNAWNKAGQERNIILGEENE